jgi:hypothetical protein
VSPVLAQDHIEYSTQPLDMINTVLVVAENGRIDAREIPWPALLGSSPLQAEDAAYDSPSTTGVTRTVTPTAPGAGAHGVVQESARNAPT